MNDVIRSQRKYAHGLLAARDRRPCEAGASACRLAVNVWQGSATTEANVSEPRVRMVDSHPSSAGWAAFKRYAPVTRPFNHLIAGTHFHEKFKRWPLPPEHPAATINDYIFARMIGASWSALERAFVDKATAKDEAVRLCPTIRVPETLLVIPMDDVRSADQLYRILRPFIGSETIAKPTHASGGATFLRDVAAAADLATLFELSSIDYISIMREMQYWETPKRVIVETVVPASTSAAPDDYKFHCVRGEPLVCQVDHNRFGSAWSRLFRIPDFAPLDESDGLVSPATYRLPAPDRIAAMVEAARALSAPFEFVRVDLYDGQNGIYFGELTFTPAASLGIAPSAKGDHVENATHRIYSGLVMQALRGR